MRYAVVNELARMLSRKEHDWELGYRLGLSEAYTDTRLSSLKGICLPAIQRPGRAVRVGAERPAAR